MASELQNTSIQTTLDSLNSPDKVLVYAPSSVEKKKVIIMYLLFGIIIMMSKVQMSVYEYYHLKQAFGWWITFVLFFLVFAVLLLIPGIKYLGFVPLLLMVVLWILFVKQAWDGKYQETKTKSPLQIFSGLGGRVMSLFEMNPKIILGLDQIAVSPIVDQKVEDNV